MNYFELFCANFSPQGVLYIDKAA